MGKQFLLWDPKEGPIPRSEDGGYLTSGLMGVCSGHEAQFTMNGLEDELDELDVHERRLCLFSMSGTKGQYFVIRIA